MNHPIDFIIPWVDGSDPAWQAEFLRVSPTEDMDARASRYRDWDLLRYWFRGVEQFAPWVNKIHFITWGHLPSWLNVEHPKLHIVNHKDYIPKQYLPTFSSHTIELNMHRIKNLAEHFVYFNDDMFLLKPLSPSFFFRNGLPCDSALMNPISTVDLCKDKGEGKIFYVPLNNVSYLNTRYDMRSCIKKNPLHWYNSRYGTYLIRNLLLSIWPRFTGFVDLHLPQPFLKHSFVKTWEEDFSIVDKSCRNAMRSDQDINQWYVRYRQLAEGLFIPKAPVNHGVLRIKSSDNTLTDAISKQKIPLCCIHDDDGLTHKQIDNEKQRLQSAFEQIKGFDKPCSYERTIR